MIDSQLMDEINDAAMQGKDTLAPDHIDKTTQTTCSVCGGDGWTKLNGERFNDCPDCNGTGKKPQRRMPAMYLTDSEKLEIGQFLSDMAEFKPDFIALAFSSFATAEGWSAQIAVGDQTIQSPMCKTPAEAIAFIRNSVEGD